MIRENEDALICDLAETYTIYDYRSLPARTVATLAVGLRNNSRIKMHLSGEILSFDQMLQVKIYDLLNWLAWTKTKKATKGQGMPERLEDRIRKKAAEESEMVRFDSVEDFEAERNRMLERFKNG